MAVIEYTALVNNMKGKIGGSVLQGGAAGNIIRANARRSGRKSETWLCNMAAFGALAGEYRNLTKAQQDQWTAAGPSFPATDKFGNQYTPSGYQLFMTLNAALQAGSLPTLTTPPAPATIPALGVLDADSPGAGQIKVSWSNPLPAGATVQVYAAAPTSTGKAYRSGEQKLLLSESTDGTTEVDISAAYSAKYGAVPSSGLVWTMAQVLVDATGQLGPICTASHDFTTPQAEGIGAMVIGVSFVVR